MFIGQLDGPRPRTPYCTEVAGDGRVGRTGTCAFADEAQFAGRPGSGSWNVADGGVQEVTGWSNVWMAISPAKLV